MTTTKTKTLLQPYRERLWCECGGEVVYEHTGHAIVTRDWRHKCDNCGVVSWQGHKYPRIVYEEVEK